MEVLREWTKEIAQPKLVTVTARNTETISRNQLSEFSKNLWRLRRQKIFASVTGGSQSIEVTNESRGWHIHGHLLVNARWIDEQQLAITWGKLVGQDYAIVDVADKRNVDAGAQAAKYVCKPAQFARWPPDQIAAFINAISGVRMFSVFGDLIPKRKKIMIALRSRRSGNVCDCGCGSFSYSPRWKRGSVESYE